jgi:hypothetical protein
MHGAYHDGAAWIHTPWSIQSVARKDDAQWRIHNRHRKALAYSYLERQLLFAGEHPVRFSASVAALVGVSWALQWVIPPDWFLNTWHGWGPGEQLAHFSTLWTVQATMAALVYPIVIAFVTIFLQRRPAAEAFIHLYMLDSGALAAGLSSLWLVVVMTLQYILMSAYGASTLPLWTALDAAWFLINATLTTFFLFKTVEFLQPNVQQRVIRRYTVNIALARDVMRLNAFQILTQSLEKGWLPAPAYSADPKSTGPHVFINPLAGREGELQALHQTREPQRLMNVRLWPLRLVVTFWMRAARKFPVSAGNAPRRRPQHPLLVLPATPGFQYEDPVTLARVQSGPPLRGWQRLLIHAAYVFKPIRRERLGIQVKSILGELAADARMSAEQSDNEAFRSACDRLVELHGLLIGASLDQNPQGETASWALLPDIQSFPDRALHIGWAETYRSIFQAAIDSLTRDILPLRRLCQLCSHLSSDDLNAAPQEIKEHLFQLPPLMMYQLAKWWARQTGEQGLTDLGPHTSVMLKAPLSQTYEEVMASFIGGWENARDLLINLRGSSKAFDWTVARKLAHLSATHIQETARMLIAAISRGDQTAAQWLADALGKWWGPVSYGNNQFELYGKVTYLTLLQINRDWPTVAATLGFTPEDLQRSGTSEASLQRGVLMAALKNYWTDIRWIVVELLLSLAASGDSSTFANSLALQVAAGMLSGKQWRSGGSIAEPLSQFTATQYLEAKIRQYAVDDANSSYTSMLDHFVSRIKDMERPEMIGSRTYSYRGADDLASLQEAQLVILAALSTQDWAVSDSLRRQIEIWLPAHNANIETLRFQISSLLTLFDQTPTPPEVLQALIVLVGKTHAAADGWLRTRNGLQSLQTAMEESHAAALEAAPIDPARLEELAEYASSKAFSQDDGNFPLQLFTEITSSPAPLQDFTLTMQQVRKGELTVDPLQQRAANEEEYWADTMAGQVGARILLDVISHGEHRDIPAPDAATYWTALKAEAERMLASGLHPILILDNQTRPEWVWQWQHADYGSEYPRPDDLQVRRLANQGDHYICHFNEIAVYAAAIDPGRSLILSKERFMSLTFRHFENGKPVVITVTERADNTALVDLHLRFSRRAQVGEDAVIHLHYIPIDDTNLHHE